MTPRRLRVAAVGGVLLLAGACAASGHTAGPPPSPATSTTAAAARAPANPSAPPVPSRPPSWQARAAAPTSLQEVASAVLDGKVWVIGGLTSAGATSSVEIYDPVADRWSTGPPLPLAVHHEAATVYRGEIVVLGGFVDAPSLYGQATDRAFALRNGAWVELPHLRRPRGAAAAAVVGDSLVLAGGRDAVALVAPTEVFDGSTWRDAAPIPTPRDHLAAVSDGTSVFTLAGRFVSPGSTTGAAERYDPVANTWERLPAVPTPRGGLGATLVGGRIVTAGGEDQTGTFGQVEAYDIAGRSWSSLPPLPTPRHGLALEHVGNQVLALVGGTAYGVAPSKVAEALAPVG